MKKELDKYVSSVMKDLPNLARVRDPRFLNEITEDSVLLGRYVTLTEARVGSYGTISNEASTTGSHNFLRQSISGRRQSSRDMQECNYTVLTKYVSRRSEIEPNGLVPFK